MKNFRKHRNCFKKTNFVKNRNPLKKQILGQINLCNFGKNRCCGQYL